MKPTGIREIDELTAYFHSQLRESRPDDALPMQVENLVSELIDRSRGLTSTERIILRYYAEGYGIKDIPDLLFISAGTVKGHNSHIYRKLGVDSTMRSKPILTFSSAADAWRTCCKESNTPAEMHNRRNCRLCILSMPKSCFGRFPLKT